jgi:hypothetical protein
MPQMPFAILHAGGASKHGVFQGSCVCETVDPRTPQPHKIELRRVRAVQPILEKESVSRGERVPLRRRKAIATRVGHFAQQRTDRPRALLARWSEQEIFSRSGPGLNPLHKKTAGE